MSAKRLRDLKGLGVKSEEMLAIVGITTVDAFMASEPFSLYAQLKKNVQGISLNALYAIIGAQENTHWQEIKRRRKMEILLRLDDMGLTPK